MNEDQRAQDEAAYTAWVNSPGERWCTHEYGPQGLAWHAACAYARQGLYRTCPNPDCQDGRERAIVERDDESQYHTRVPCDTCRGRGVIPTEEV